MALRTIRRRSAAPPRFLAECLGVARRAVRIVAGETSRTKVLEVEGITPEQVTSLRERALR